MRNNCSSFFERCNNRKLPDYYPTMYLDGYSPDEIYASFKRQQNEELNKKPRQVNITINGKGLKK